MLMLSLVPKLYTQRYGRDLLIRPEIFVEVGQKFEYSGSHKKLETVLIVDSSLTLQSLELIYQTLIE